MIDPEKYLKDKKKMTAFGTNGETEEDFLNYNDPINHPSHYTSHPSGIECIQVSEWFPANIAQAIQYLWRHEHKNGDEDLDKAIWFIQRQKQLRMKMREKGMLK